jgi:hypothetical protein
MASVSSSNVAPSVDVHRCATGVMYHSIKNDPAATVQAIWEGQKLCFSFQRKMYVVPEEIGDYHIVFRIGQEPLVSSIGPNEPCSPRSMHICDGAEVTSFDIG